MGCCNSSVFVLAICTLQLLTIVERIIFDFHNYLYASLIANFTQVIIVIVAIFGLCLYKQRLLFTYLAWGVVFIVWNVFVICVYSEVGEFNEKSFRIFSFMTSSSFWVELTKECDSCSLTGAHIEIIHAALQILLSLTGCVASGYVVHTLRKKDDPNPFFQVYKAPSSRRSSMSLRVDRDNTLTGGDHWVTPDNARDSMRSVRSTRSNRGVVPTENRQESSTRRSKRSNRGSTRSKGHPSNSNGSAHGNRPWEPQIAPSSGVDSDHALSPNSPTRRIPGLRGHENESYGNDSLSEAPYSDYMSGNRTPGPPPGPVPLANRRGPYKPVNLSQSFNAVDDLPPPLDEGPEAYSRSNEEFPAPPPPLTDGPDPYTRRNAGTIELNNLSRTNDLPRPPPNIRPSHINITNPHHQMPPPSTSSESSEKSPLNSALTSPSTPEKPLQLRPQATERTLPLTTQNLRAHANAMQYPAGIPATARGRNISPPGNITVRQPGIATDAMLPSNNAAGRPINQANTPPYSEYAQINVQPNGMNMRIRSPQRNGVPSRDPGDKYSAHPASSDPKPIADESAPRIAGSTRYSSENLGFNASPAPVKDNTFRRMITGNLTVAPQTQPNGAHKSPPENDSVNELYSQPQKPGSGADSKHTQAAMSNVSHPQAKGLSPHQHNHTSAGIRPVVSADTPSHDATNKTKSDIPPWERNKSTNLSGRNQRPDPSQHSRPNTNGRLDSQPESHESSDSFISRPVGEVTSSYGGLYSSRGSPGPRRRSYYGRERPTAQNTRQPATQMYPGNSDYVNHSTNATDDIKTKGGPFVSSSALVV